MFCRKLRRRKRRLNKSSLRLSDPRHLVSCFLCFIVYFCVVFLSYALSLRDGFADFRGIRLRMLSQMFKCYPSVGDKAKRCMLAMLSARACYLSEHFLVELLSF